MGPSFASSPGVSHSMSSPRRNRALNRPPPIPFDEDDVSEYEQGDIFSLAGRKRRRLPSDNAAQENTPPSRAPRTAPPLTEIIDLTTEGRQDEPIDLDAEDEASDDEVQIIYDRPRVHPHSEPSRSNPPTGYHTEQYFYSPFEGRGHLRPHHHFPSRVVNPTMPLPRESDPRPRRAPDFLLPDLSELFFSPTPAYFGPRGNSPRGGFRPPWSRYLADYRWEEPSYEFLSSLDRTVAKKNCASKKEISALPVRRITMGDVKEDKCCAICLCDFELGERVKTLPCSHYFHVQCIGEWLRVNKICPVDRKNIITGESD